MTAWSSEIPLVGAGREPVDLRRTLLSHGFVELPPTRLDEDAPALEVTLLADKRTARTVEIRPGKRATHVSAFSDGRLRPAPRRSSSPASATSSGSTKTLSEFYALVGEDPDLSWATEGAGRMVRSPTVFEDVVKEELYGGKTLSESRGLRRTRARPRATWPGLRTAAAPLKSMSL